MTLFGMHLGTNSGLDNGLHSVPQQHMEAVNNEVPTSSSDNILFLLFACSLALPLFRRSLTTTFQGS